MTTHPMPVAPITPAQPPAPGPVPASWPASRWRTAALASGAVAYLLLIAMVVTFWIQYPPVRGPLQVAGGMLIIPITAVPAWIGAVRRR
ncbi:hypothetical protein ACFPFX_12370 [Streptomyces mauvecolor]|uniref:Integral membrane protein n=1 Tax=Streptomyces mauvecolor TaxID=58345 RepID=A0ABV9UJ53_9ACTN